MEPHPLFLADLPQRWHGRALEALKSNDIFSDVVTVRMEDGSQMVWQHATLVQGELNGIRREALVLTEHCGYFALHTSIYDEVEAVSMGDSLLSSYEE